VLREVRLQVRFFYVVTSWSVVFILKMEAARFPEMLVSYRNSTYE